MKTTKQGSVNIEFSKGLSYNSCCTQSSPLVMFVCKAKSSVPSSNHHAPGLANTAPLLLRDSSHSLRRNGPVAAFLQQAGTSPLVAAIPEDVAMQRRLSSLRPHPGSALRCHGRHAAHQQDRNSAVQRHLPVLAGARAVPRPVHLAPIPQADESPLRPSARHLARPLASSTVCSAQKANRPHLRSRFCGPDRLWQTAI